MPLKITAFFKLREAGWREVWYGPKGGGTSARDYRPTVDNVLGIRAEMLSSQATLELVSIQDMAVRRAATLSTRWNEVDNGPANVLDRDTAGVCYAGRAYGEGRLNIRNLHFRGVPDNWVTYTLGSGNIHPLFQGIFTRFRQAVIDAGWSVRGLNKQGPPNGPADQKITDVRMAAGDTLLRIYCPGHGYADGTRIRIRNARFSPLGFELPINTSWRVITPTAAGADQANSFNINYIPPAGATWAYQGGGLAREQVFAYWTVVDMVASALIGRATGRAPIVRKGRYRRNGRKYLAPQDAMGALPIAPIIRIP